MIGNVDLMAVAPTRVHAPQRETERERERERERARERERERDTKQYSYSGGELTRPVW